MRFALLACVLLLVPSAWSADAEPAAESSPSRVPLWPEGAGPQFDKAADGAGPWITVHHPDAPSGTAMVICPGGGYRGLVTEQEGHGIARWLNRHGITGVVLEYRLPRGRAAVPLADAQRAIRTVRATAEEWDVRPNRIGIIGFSAGGHLASTAATQFDDGDPAATDPIARVSSRPDFAVLVYPVISMGELAHTGSRTRLLGEDAPQELRQRYSSELRVTAATPPMFLTHAVDDKVVAIEHSRRMQAALERHGVPSRLLELASGGHGLNGYQGPMWDAWQTEVLKWIKQTVR